MSAMSDATLIDWLRKVAEISTPPITPRLDAAADRLPPALAAALDALGIRQPPPPRTPDAPAWKPTRPGEEPPF